MRTQHPPLAARASGAPSRRAPRSTLEVLRRFVWDLMAHDAFNAAACIAFWMFLSLVPLLVLLGYLVGQVARTRGVDALLDPVLELVPSNAVGLIRKEISRMSGSNAAPVAPLGVAGFLWTASAGIHNLMDVFETAVKARRRPWWQQRVMAVGWVLVGLATACGLAWVLVKADAELNAYDTPATAPSSSPAPSAAPGRGEHGQASRAAPAPKPKPSLRRRVHRALSAPGEKTFAAVLLLGAAFALLAGFFWFAVEHPPGVRRRVLPGTATALASWLGVSWAFGAYAVSIADYALYYGGLTAVAILLLWLYLSSLALVVGAEVNAQVEGLRRT